MKTLSLAVLTLLISITTFAQDYNLLKDFTPNQNPDGVFSYGYGTVGGDFTPCAKMDKRETASIWASNEGWKGVYFNPVGGKDITLSTGLVLKAGMVMMHPGNKADHLSKVRFTAPADGNYAVNAKWTTQDVQAKKSWNWVYTNATSEKGATFNFTPKGFKEIFSKGLTGHNQSNTFSKTVAMKKGEILSFEMGNGGDQYFDDAQSFELTIKGSSDLIGHFTFEGGSTKDLTGNFSDLELKGATISNGALNVNTNAFAQSTKYAGPSFTEKTIVSWAKINNPAMVGGSILTVGRPTSNHDFDAIVYGERQAQTWMAGSGWFKRTRDLGAAAKEPAPEQYVKMAITYGIKNGQTHVSVYRNDKLVGEYTQGASLAFAPGTAAVMFGKRHFSGGLPNKPWVDATIQEARIYKKVLSVSEMEALRPVGYSDIKITSATWSNGARSANVTARVQELADDGSASIWARNHVLNADPAKGVQKTLKVIYTKGGKTFTKSVLERQYLEF